MLRRLRDSCDDGGFSLVESVIALTIAAIAFSALAAGMISSLKAVVNGRQAQQASRIIFIRDGKVERDEVVRK